MPTDKKSTGSKKHRVLIVDDHPIVRDGLRMLIDQQHDLEVCGDASDPNEAIQKIRELEPEIMIVDISLREGSGLDLIERAQKLDPDLPILVSSMHDESLYAERAIRAGARGYVKKEVSSKTILEGLRSILEGKIYLSEAMAQRFLESSTGKSGNTEPMSTLSNRELRVFELIGQGLSTRKIAEKLHLSIKTVETYREKIKEKLHLEDASELAQQAARWVLENQG